MKPLVNAVAFLGIILGLASPLEAQTANPPNASAPSINMPAPSQPSAASEKATTSPPQAATENPTAASRTQRPKRQVRRAPRRYAFPYPYGYYGPWGSPNDHVANELNRGQLQGGWYGAGTSYPYAPYAPYQPRPYYVPRPYYPWGY